MNSKLWIFVKCKKMGFRENLKQELSFNGMLVKELAAASGVPKRALDTYLLSENASIPSADTAVKIARALGVSVEYLVTGTEGKTVKAKPPLSPDMHLLIDIGDKLAPKNRRLAIKLVKALKEQETEEKK